MNLLIVAYLLALVPTEFRKLLGEVPVVVLFTEIQRPSDFPVAVIVSNEVRLDWDLAALRFVAERQEFSELARTDTGRQFPHRDYDWLDPANFTAQDLTSCGFFLSGKRHILVP
jgi:hypothetical protein